MHEIERPHHSPDPASADIEVLLVDDNEQWARFLSEEIEKGSDRISVAVVHSANEALTALNTGGGIDCIVADYRMPEIDGLQLLDRVREEQPELPFILVTGAGSEDIASEAIDRGVSDYLIKNPRSDQTSEFINRISTAVDQYRLRTAVRESEERYRQVVQQSRDAIAIFDAPEHLRFWNDRLLDLTGRTESQLLEEDFVASFVYPDDRADLREKLSKWIEDRTEGVLHHARIVTPDGALRDCEFTGGGISHQGTEAALVSIRDVTERRQRERELEWERELNRTIQRVLIESRTREELERSVAEHLLDYGYRLVWFGEPSGGGTAVRIAEGETAYLDAIDPAASDDLGDREPGVWAAASGEPQFIDDFSALFETAWRDAALEHGLQAGAALPLAHAGVSYGLLAVYGEAADPFDATERRLLTQLADTVSYAVHNIETERAMSAGTTIDVELEVTGAGYYLVDIAGSAEFRADEGELTVHGALPYGDDRTLQYVSVEGLSPERFVELARERPAVADVRQLTDDGEPTGRVQVILEDPTPERQLITHGAIVHATTVRPHGAVLDLELPATADLREIVESLRGRFDAVSVLSRTEAAVPEAAEQRPRQIDLDSLTDKQAMALEAAFHHGYFEQPRRNSATDVAESLDISHSTFLQHLRTAQRKVFGDLYA